MQKTVTALTLLLAFSTCAFAGEVIDSFESSDNSARLAQRGDWTFADGVAACESDPDLYKKYNNHGPIIRWQAEFTDAEIEFEMKASDCQRIVFTLNGDGHVFRMVSFAKTDSSKAKAGKAKRASQQSRLIAWGTKSSKENKGDSTLLEDFPTLDQINDQWVGFSLRVKDGKAQLKLGDASIDLEHVALGRDKKEATLSFAEGSIAIRNFEMSVQ